MSTSEEEAQHIQKQITLLESNLRKYLSKDALTRYFTIKSTNPQFALQVAAFVYEAVNQKYIKEQLSDNEFKGILNNIKEPKKEFRINLFRK